MTKQEIRIMKSLCDIRMQLEKPCNDLWQIYKSLNRQTPTIIDDMLEEIMIQAQNIAGAAHVISQAQPCKIEDTIERSTLNELFEEKV